MQILREWMIAVCVTSMSVRTFQSCDDTIDSVNVRLDSIGRGYGAMLLDREYAGVNTYSTRIENGLPVKTRKKFAPVTALVNVDSIFRGKTIRERQRYVSYAIEWANQNVGEMEFKSFSTTDDKKTIIRHQIEMHKKFTLSFCLLDIFSLSGLRSVRYYP